MRYIEEEKESFQLVGIAKEFSLVNANQEIPEFWEELEHQGLLNSTAYPFKIGEFGICFDEINKDGKFNYMIGGAYHGGAVPEGFTIVDFPKMTWLRFKCIGPLPQALQDMNYEIFTKWLPCNDQYEQIKKYNIEWYCDELSQSEENLSEIWIPVRRK